MKVGGSGHALPLSGPAAQGARASGEGFSLEPAGPAGSAGPAHAATAAGPLGSLEALLALQETSTATEKRRRAVRRAGSILDALDELKVAVLDASGLDAQALGRLQRAVAEARGETEDPGLEALLGEIDARAAVELAKREMRRAA